MKKKRYGRAKAGFDSPPGSQMSSCATSSLLPWINMVENCRYRGFAINPWRNHINRVPLKHGDVQTRFIIAEGNGESAKLAWIQPCADDPLIGFLNKHNSNMRFCWQNTLLKLVVLSIASSAAFTLCATARILPVSSGSNAQVQAQCRYIPVVHPISPHLRTRDPRSYVDSFYHPHVERRGSGLSRLGGSRRNNNDHNNNHNNGPNKLNEPKGPEKTKKEKLKESLKKFGNSFLEPNLIPSLEAERRIVAMSKLEELTAPQGQGQGHDNLNFGLNHSKKPPPGGGSGSGSASTNTGGNGRGGGRIHMKRRDGGSKKKSKKSNHDGEPSPVGKQKKPKVPKVVLTSPEGKKMKGVDKVMDSEVGGVRRVRGGEDESVYPESLWVGWQKQQLTESQADVVNAL
ncbi:hypothetical protein C8Q75DRAFT_738026 [Abortiporus biennis]|nr:hypothetical protein C8Q75DRAFT_738026 [Abortiporus biennis]